MEHWSASQRHVVAAAFLGWMLDAFDFLIVVFVLRQIAGDFAVPVHSLAWALTATLAMRPVGAFLFGRMAEHYGRRPALIASVLLYSVMEFSAAFAHSLGVFIALRALYGIAMGGEWGVGAALAFESVPVRSRGWVSGLLQSGYPRGYLLAAIAFGALSETIGWRGLFMLGAAPALLVLYVRSRVPESRSWSATRPEVRIRGLGAAFAGHWGLTLYAVGLMTAFNFFSHGTQDLYPTLLGAQRGFATGTIARIAMVYNGGAICGGIAFGALSGRIGRRRAIACAALLALPALPAWGYAHDPTSIALAAFALQFLVQGAWGVVPVHLNELAPSALRATFPGVVYQLGNLIASVNAPLQSGIAAWRAGSAPADYAFALTAVSAVVALSLAVLAALGPERRGASFADPGSGAAGAAQARE